jgi:hypothetical protein
VSVPPPLPTVTTTSRKDEPDGVHVPVLVAFAVIVTAEPHTVHGPVLADACSICAVQVVLVPLAVAVMLIVATLDGKATNACGDGT